MCHLAPGTPILRVPDSLPDEVVCPANCATATVAAALRIAGGCQDQVVLIQGVGMLGLTACAMARCGGAREVIACDVDPHRVELAAGFGATRSVLVGWDGEELAGVVKDRTEGRGVDLAIDMSGAPSAMESGLDLLRIGGRYVLVGAVFPSRPLSISAETMVRRLLTIQGIHNYAPQDLAAAIDFLDQNHQRYPFVDLISETFPLTRVEAAFQYAVEQRPLRVAVIPATDNC